MDRDIMCWDKLKELATRLDRAEARVKAQQKIINNFSKHFSKDGQRVFTTLQAEIYDLERMLDQAWEDNRLMVDRLRKLETSV